MTRRHFTYLCLQNWLNPINFGLPRTSFIICATLVSPFFNGYGPASRSQSLSQLNHFILLRYDSRLLVRWSRRIVFKLEPFLFFDRNRVLGWICCLQHQQHLTSDLMQGTHDSFTTLNICWLFECVEILKSLSRLFLARYWLLLFIWQSQESYSHSIIYVLISV